MHGFNVCKSSNCLHLKVVFTVLSISPSPGGPSLWFGDASRSPPDRSMLLKSSTPKSSQAEVRTSRGKFGTLDIWQQESSSSGFVAFLESSRPNMAYMLWSGDSWKAAGHLAQPSCCVKSNRTRVQWILALVCNIFGLLWLVLCKGLYVLKPGL